MSKKAKVRIERVDIAPITFSDEAHVAIMVILIYTCAVMFFFSVFCIIDRFV